MINSYSFGSIIIDGRKYRSDVIIFPERVNSKWWRKSGHLLLVEDIQEIIKFKPKVLIIGTGSRGLMKVDEETKNRLESLGIGCIIKKTSEAVEEYNKISKEEELVVGAFHLTC